MQTAPRERSPTIKALQELMASDMEKVNHFIDNNLFSDAPLIPQVSNYLISSGGKRLRPLLTVASANMCEYKGEKHIALAACIEFIHSATLLHDDVVDESTLRRGLETANQVWSNQSSILVGDFLLSRAFEKMVEAGSLKALEIVSKASATLAEGEVNQLSASYDIHLSQEKYLEIITSKTACLFQAASHVGAVIAEGSEDQERALADFGLNLGIAFQLVDDLLDYTAHSQDLGKAVGDDFREGKVTLPVILAYGRADPEEKKFWQRVLQDFKQEEGDLESALELMQSHNVFADVFKLAEHYAYQAGQSIEGFPESPLKYALMEVSEFSVRRYY